jgi:hypothetical protein
VKLVALDRMAGKVYYANGMIKIEKGINIV